jgi:hypothetical protein
LTPAPRHILDDSDEDTVEAPNKRSVKYDLKGTSGSKIAERDVWFSQQFTTEEARNTRAELMKTEHRRWKKESKPQYARACIEHIQARQLYEWNLVEWTWNYQGSYIRFPTELTFEELGTLTGPYFNTDDMDEPGFYEEALEDDAGSI